jgi:hypothetical protein
MSKDVVLPRMNFVSSEVNQMPGGMQVIVKFRNGYGASVVNHSFSYGVELAVLDPRGEITYDTPITGDVLGWLDSESLAKALKEIEAL